MQIINVKNIISTIFRLKNLRKINMPNKFMGKFNTIHETHDSITITLISPHHLSGQTDGRGQTVGLRMARERNPLSTGDNFYPIRFRHGGLHPAGITI